MDFGMKYLPNILTCIRLIMVPVFMSVYLKGYVLWGTVIFVLAAITDVVDGYIARKYNVVSKIGTLLDPLADKIMQIAAATALIIKGKFPPFLIFLLVSKELAMVLTAMISYNREDLVIPSKFFGKAGSVVIVFSMALLMLFTEIMADWVKYILYGCITISIVGSGIGYLIEFIKYKRNAKNGEVNE